jgi:hypothetical protein
VKVLTLTQPWASLVALGHKRVETRSWRPSRSKYGVIAIHAAKGYPKRAREFALTEYLVGRLPERVPLGAIVAVAVLAKCERTEDVGRTVSALECHLGDFSRGRWAWFLEDVHTLSEPVPCRGALGLWECSEGLDVLVMARMYQHELQIPKPD